MGLMPEQDAVKSAALSIASNIIETDHSDIFLLNMIKHMIAFGDHIISRTEIMDSDDRIECSCGCSYCCHMQVKVTPPETFLIFAFILENYTRDQKTRLQQRIRHNRHLTEGKRIEERVLL